MLGIVLLIIGVWIQYSNSKYYPSTFYKTPFHTIIGLVVNLVGCVGLIWQWGWVVALLIGIFAYSLLLSLLQLTIQLFYKQSQI